MALLEYNEVTARKYIIFEGEPYEVIENNIFRMQQRKPQNKTKIKNLLNGRVVEATFHAADKVEEAEIGTEDAKHLYANKGEYWFCDAEDPSKRFKISTDVLGVQALFLKPNTIYQTKIFIDPETEEKTIFGVRLPPTVDLKVVEAPPGIKGDTARGGNKLVKVETGAMITVPLFVNEGETIRINTDTGEYRERVTK
ncbi:MAG TPA: elongation factor P [Candidatus Paceibacterota bacterium]|nr:elongation factor P [Candidatus Paceibacterota bacterium]